MLTHLLPPGQAQALGTTGSSWPCSKGLVNSGTQWGPWGEVKFCPDPFLPKLARAPGKGSQPAMCHCYF